LLPAATAGLFPGLAIDLGGRRLELLHTPGHTADSIMLLDRAAGILFTGDAVYPAALYAHFDSSEYGRSSLDVYANTMYSLQLLTPFLSHLCCSHNVPVNPPSLLRAIAGGFRQVLAGQSESYIDEDGFRRHDFPGFAIITGQPQ
jgi:glyoxylase-like metal-dependent hydrolase (beta-lactamase superfamily II)